MSAYNENGKEVVMDKKPYKYDVPVLMIFFCRDKMFQQVFEAVKNARPSKLYLYQDGARPNNDSDVAGINKCREIADGIDWDCEVYTMYQEKNFGCDPSEFIAQRWFFSNVEYGIVLEDDDVPSESFFPYCLELLKKYKDDERINIICGMNNEEVSPNVDSSYFFSKTGSIWGWASWKRVVSKWDEHYNWLNNKNDLNNMRKQFINDYSYNSFMKTVERHKASNRAHYESIGGADTYLYNRLNIVPKYNMITNIGLGEIATHAASDIRIYPKKVQKLFFMKRYEIEFPLKHPQYVMEDEWFAQRMESNRKKEIANRVEHILRVVRYYGFKPFAKKIKSILK